MWKRWATATLREEARVSTCDANSMGIVEGSVS